MTASHMHLRAAESAAPPIPFNPTGPVAHRAWPFMTLRHEVFPPGNRYTEASAMCTVILHLKPNGHLMQERNGQRDRRIARQGDIVIVNADTPVFWHGEESQEWLSIGLSPDLLNRAASGGERIQLREVLGTRDAMVELIGKTLLSELEAHPSEARPHVESLAGVLALHLARTYAAPADPRGGYKGGLPPFKFRRVLDFIHENLDENLSLAGLAALVDLSPAHFCREFKRTAGLAPHKYLTQKRLEAAQRLLAETDLPIVEVSLQAGFQSQSHFTTTFRQRLGITPKSYRIHNRWGHSGTFARGTNLVPPDNRRLQGEPGQAGQNQVDTDSN